MNAVGPLAARSRPTTPGDRRFAPINRTLGHVMISQYPGAASDQADSLCAPLQPAFRNT